MEKQEKSEYKGKRFEEKLRGYPGIYKIWVWDELKLKYVDVKYQPEFKQKPYRAKKRVVVLGKNVQLSKSFDSLIEAKAWKEGNESQHVEQVLFTQEKKEPKYTVGQLIEEWRKFYAPPKIELSTYEMLGKDVQHFQVLREIEVEDLSSAHIDQWLLVLKAPGYPRKSSRMTYAREVKTLGSLLRWYREYKNPKYAVPMLQRHKRDSILKPKKPKQLKSLTAVELESFLQALNKNSNPVYYYLASTQVFTGMRIGEVCGLSWENVDLENQWITISQIVWWSHRTKEPFLREGTKTGHIRKVFICDRLKELLLEWKLKSGRKPGLVFQREHSEPMGYTSIQGAFNRAFQALQLPFSSTHILRHTFATLFVHQTGNREALRSVLGHQTFRMTERYAHTMEESQFIAMQKFDLGKKEVHRADPQSSTNEKSQK